MSSASYRLLQALPEYFGGGWYLTFPISQAGKDERQEKMNKGIKQSKVAEEEEITSS